MSSEEPTNQSLLSAPKTNASITQLAKGGNNQHHQADKAGFVPLATLKSRYTRLVIMNYAIAAFSGFMLITSSVNFYYINDVLHGTNIQFSEFSAFTGLSWTIKPVYGYISEFFFPFKYRLKSYIVFCCTGIFASTVTIFILKPQLELYNWLFFAVMLFYGVIDTIGEGLTALILQTDKQVKLMRSMADPDSDDALNNKKAFGNFYNFRNLIRTGSIFLGGILATYQVDPGYVYLSIGVLSVVFGVYTIFGFYEPRREVYFSDW